MISYHIYHNMTIYNLFKKSSCANQKLYDNCIIYLFCSNIMIYCWRKQKKTKNKNELRQLGCYKKILLQIISFLTICLANRVTYQSEMFASTLGDGIKIIWSIQLAE